MSGLSEAAVAYLTHHTVLPPELPQADDVDPSHEITLLKTTISSLRAFQHIFERQHSDSAEQVGAVASMIEKLLFSRDRDGNISELQLANLLRDLIGTPSATIPLEIKAQNAALIIRIEGNCVIFEAFELAPPNNQVMSTKGRLIRSFPTVACCVPVAKLSEKGLIAALAHAIAKMSSQAAPGFQPRVRKAGQDHDEDRDTTHPGLITDYLMTIISAVGKPMEVLPQGLWKNTREEVLWSNAKRPWRRSPLWLLVRVAMQLRFAHSATNSLYKPFMVFFFSQILRHAKGYHGTIRSEVLYVISAKLTRRIRKLDTFFETQPSFQDWMSVVTTSLNEAHNSMNCAWEAIANDSELNIDTSLLNTLNPSEDLNIKLEGLDGFISNIASRKRLSNASEFRPTAKYPQYMADLIPSSVNGDSGYEIFRLAAAEMWVENHLVSWLEHCLAQESTCEKILQFVKAYHSTASSAYINLPSSLSVMYLCILELWVACDRSACHIYPLLREYDPELHLEPLQALSLPHKTHLKRLEGVEQYVRLRRARANSHRSSVMCNFGHISSFAVKFFDQSSAHQALRSRIERDAKSKRQQKREELSDKQERYRKLMKAYDEGKCEYRDVVIDQYHGYTESRHSPSCQRCSKRNEADSIDIYVNEWPLSSIDRVAKATVFELQIPVAFSNWRDATNYVAKNVLGFVQTCSERPRSRYTLSGHEDLCKLRSVPFSQRIFPLSQTKPHTGTHRKLKSGVSLLTESDICLANGLQYEYYDDLEGAFTGSLKSTDRISKQCIYTLPSRSSELQVYVQPGAAVLAPNQVIATLSSCPPHIAVDEYKAFGALPLGYCVQYMNILTQLAMPTIDFAKTETHCMILQTIHHVGPQSQDYTVERKSHRILSNESFGLALHKELEVALRRFTENWETWRAVAVFVQLAIKLLSLTRSEKVRSRCLSYLVDARQLCLNWLDNLKQRLQTVTDDGQRTELCSRVTEIALLCATTLDVDGAHVEELLSTPLAVFALLRCSIIVQENEKATHPEHAFLYHVMLQSWKSTLYRIFPILLKDILWRKASSQLNEAVKASWSIFSPTDHWTQVNDPWSHWIQTKCGTLQVHFNLLTAELLVKGLPLSRLPSKYVQHQMYISLFGKSSMEVMPTEERGMDVAAKHAYRGYHLFFGMTGPDMLVVAGNGKEKLDLVPPRFFEDRVPTAFVTDYVHWYNRHTKEVEFRPVKDPWLPANTRWRLKSQGYTWRLVNEQATLINVDSNTAGVLSNIFAPLEKAAHIHIIFESLTRSITIEMPRIQLVFYLQHGNHLIHSREYRGMVVDSDQRLGTLNGLSSKLILVNARDTRERSVLIPEGHISFRKFSDHVAVYVNQDTGVKIHAYTIDQILGRITDNGSLQSKLYLAYIHALTSHCLPDLLTGQTGTEAALSILRSGAIGSFGLFTNNNIAILSKIAGLSAGRVYYPMNLQDMQQITWDWGLPFLSQDSSFHLAVEKIFKQTRAMKLFYSQGDYIEPESRADIHRDLLERDLIRSSTFRVDGFGAEGFTTRFDRIYQGRVKIGDSNRGERAFIAASLILRNDTANHSTINTSNLNSVLASDILGGSSVYGPKSALKSAKLRFDAIWLQKPTSFLPTMWCDLHLSLAMSRGSYNKFDIMIWLSTAAFAESAVMDVIQTLAAFYKCSEFDSIEIPSFTELSLAKGDAPSLTGVKTYISYGKSFQSSPEYLITKHYAESNQQWQSRRTNAFQQNQAAAIGSFARAIHGQWPCERPTKPFDQNAETYLETEKAMTCVRSWYKELYDNRRFGIYLKAVCASMGRLPTVRVSIPRLQVAKSKKRAGDRNMHRSINVQGIFALEAPTYTSHGQLRLPKAPKKVELRLRKRKAEGEHRAQDRLTMLCNTLNGHAASTCEQSYVSDLQQSCDSLCSQQSDASIRTVMVDTNTVPLLKAYLADCQQYFGKLNLLLANVVKSCRDIGTTIHQSPRISATFWLQQLNRDRYGTLSKEWRAVIVLYGLAVTEIHRAQRLIALSNHPQDLAEELRNCGHRNWDPAEFPETLLLEAESGILVREVQEEIAKQMRSPPNGSNSVMQLNMGEGKSSVIVPIVAAALADWKTLVRVIIAKPQSNQMLQMLVSKLGGLLNRRIYHMPFSRALRLTAAQAETIHSLYQECMSTRGILLVQPEHILSFKLMGIECLIGGQTTIGKSLLRTQQFFDTSSRDIVDESDENFSVKFELVYTMGSQRPIELSPERWIVVQTLMDLLARCAALVKMELPDSIEYDDRWEERYPRVRTLRDDGEEKLLDLVARHICEFGLQGLPIVRLSQKLRDAVYQYIRYPEPAAKEIKSVEEGAFWTDSTKHALMLVRGLVAGGVLRFALRAKRWRVNYGIDPNRSPKTKLAVPYRSKDSPSPRSEFSHPDVVFVLTSLTYYYGGLEDDDLFDVFAHLIKSDQAEIEYGQWVRTATSLPVGFRHLGGVNIEDRYQCIAEVFPSLRYSKGVVDYFLSHIVFPKEMKEFPHKLSASGWDIGIVKPQPLTGFSGTNDSRHVLPLSVHHLDLPTQQHTNALVLAHLLQNENSVRLLPTRTAADGSDAEHLLRIVHSMVLPTRVILDVGAQILELNNLQVVERWLEMSDVHTAKAAVFFNDHEELSVLDRTGRVEPLQTSPFVKQLDVCLVYLDEAHTRGTDLKLPWNYRAAVTLGANLTKDRLVQACMRMRKLGKGQSVVFCIPVEIQTKILEHTKKPTSSEIGVLEVLEWAISETWFDMRRSMPLWATQGHRFEKHKGLLRGTETSQEQAQKFLEAEAQSIESRYRPRTQNTTVQGWDIANENIAKILARCREFDTMNFTSATLQEEQERELSPEVEEERQVQRPPPMQPEKHKLEKDLVQLVETGSLVANSRVFIPAFEALYSTSAAKHFNLLQFPKDLMVTADYVRTVQRPSGLSTKSYVSDSYQRPVQWILSVPDIRAHTGTSQSIKKLVILSPYEADQLLDKIQKFAKVTLHLYAPRPNMAYDPLDRLQLFTTGHCFDPLSVPRSLTVQLNLFAGQLYFASYDEYVELCGYLGLATIAPEEDQEVEPDGFVKPPIGRWGMAKSPVKFLRDMVTMVRREGESADKTHLGRMLDGAVLETHEFE